MITPEPLAPAYHFLIPDRLDDPREAVREWQAHLDGPHESNTFVGSLHAGRLGNRPPLDAQVAANAARTDALFRSFRPTGGIW